MAETMKEGTKARRPSRGEVTEAKDELKRTLKLLKKHRARIGDVGSTELEERTQKVTAALKAKDATALQAAMLQLKGSVDKHLGFVKRHPNLDFALSIGKALGIALLLRFFIVEPYKIPSGSMIPTLQIGDHLFISKLSYGIRLPGLNKLVAHWGGYQRGDVVVFVPPFEEGKPILEQRDFIKRIVGLPGDTIEVKDEVLFVNGQPQARKTLDPTYHYFDYREETGEWIPATSELIQETLTETDRTTRTHLALRDVDRDHPELQGPFKVPEGKLFMMGDNRDNSADGRFNGGWYVPFANVKGRALFIWMSWGETGWLRFERFFKGVE